MTAKMTAKTSSYREAVLTLVVGSETIAAVLPELAAAAEAWGQSDEVLEFPHHASMPMFPRRKPLLLLFRMPGSQDICAAVSVFVYAASCFGSRLVANGDRLGRRGVYGPAADRIKIAAVAAQEFLRQGASLVHLDFMGKDLSANPAERMLETDLRRKQVRLVLSSEDMVNWRFFPRIRYVDLPLFQTLEETMSGMGKRTRRNLRHHRRQGEQDLGNTFHAHVAMELAEFLALNRRSHHALSREVAEWRYATSREKSAFLVGIQTRDGQWFALAGGRIVGETAILDWQMHSQAFAKYSVSLVMRGYLMEHFGEQGMRWLLLEGGTSHVIAEAFRRRTVYHLHVERRALWVRMLGRFLRRFFPRRGMTLSLFGGFAAAKHHPRN